MNRSSYEMLFKMCTSELIEMCIKLQTNKKYMSTHTYTHANIHKNTHLDFLRVYKMTLRHSMEPRLCQFDFSRRELTTLLPFVSNKESQCLNETNDKESEKKAKNASKRFMTSLLFWNHKNDVQRTLNR